jgi:aspartyl-tRNA(Asn)/glutamyl-tRNA(Gln) amidotransferase subunit A
VTAGELLRAFERRELSPVEATRACLDAIARHDDTIHAFCLVDEDSALAAARASEARWGSGEPAGLLDGVPVAVKDALYARGWPTLRGFTTAPPGATWEDDAPAVAALRRHGAVLLGKTTLPQIGWKAVTDRPGAPTTRNPFDPSRTSGGSSGGSAAAVAQGMAPLAVGTDGAGSIRIPASFCGIVGLKPTYARVPLWPPSPFGLLSHAGPMSRTVDDAALMLDVMAEPDPRDWSAPPPPSGRYARSIADGLEGLRVAFSADLGYVEHVDPEVAAAVADAARAFEELGAHVESEAPGFANPREALDTLWKAGAGAAVAALDPSQRAELDPALADVAREAEHITAIDWLRADAERARLGAAMGRFHEDWDLLLTPTMPIPAFEADRNVPDGWPDSDWASWTPFTYPFNLTQQPAATVPCGRTSDGLPIGLQIVGPRHAEARVLRAARAYEHVHG